MIDRKQIEDAVRGYVAGTPLFLVAVKVSSTGKVTVLADRKEGITIEECVDLSRFIEKTFDREKEDYELQVSSPGIDMPFVVIEQYYKNEGKEIEVLDNEGKKWAGILRNVTTGGFELIITVKRKKSKTEAEVTEKSFNYEQVKSAKEVLKF
ncbi:MAG: ribosome assembly cofactor RimP [Bacteroidales bacterium]